MPVRRDAEGRYHAEVCIGRRRLHRRLPQGATAGDAKRLEAELTRSLHSDRTARLPTIPGDPLLTELVGAYRQVHAKTLRSTSTALHHANRLGPWLEGRRASEARQVAAKFISDARKAYKPATINRSLGILKKSLSLAWENGHTPVDYSSLVKRLPENNARSTVLTMAEVQHLAEHASEAVRTAIWISLLTGCRRGEILAMQRGDISPDTITIHAGNTKTLRTRTVPIIAPARPWLAKLPIGINFEGLKSGFRRAREAAGMPHVTFHDLRRSCGTLLIQRGVELHVVSKLLGHSSTTVTERVYAHLGANQLHAGLDALTALHRDLHTEPREVA